MSDLPIRKPSGQPERILPSTVGPSVTVWTTEKVGMIAFLCSEAAFFATLIVAYVTYIGASTNGPQPSQSLDLVPAIVNSVFLLTSSVTIMLAVKSFPSAKPKRFVVWMAITITLGLLFLASTAWEWSGLIGNYGLTIGRNLFGSTFFTLIGFHTVHVTVGLGVMALFLWKRLRNQFSLDSQAPELLSWYWHLVDAVWVVIVIVVYVLGH
ncbi:MAG: heme-copper oxidase subunit III [Planctomycetales bacterium]|nr:heme-copper oxidase subunit III [Planctomycetales bacterium]